MRQRLDQKVMPIDHVHINVLLSYTFMEDWAMSLKRIAYS